MKLLDLLIEETELNIKLFHRLSNKSNLELTDFIRSAITNGLIRNDNGEVGNVIWFSDNYDEGIKSKLKKKWYGSSVRMVLRNGVNEMYV